LADVVFGHAYAYGALAVLEELRDLVVGVEHESKGARQMLFHQTECGVVDLLGKLRYLADVFANEGQAGFDGVQATQFADTVYRFGVVNIAA